MEKTVLKERETIEQVLLERQITALNYQTTELVSIKKNIQFLAFIAGFCFAGGVLFFLVSLNW